MTADTPPAATIDVRGLAPPEPMLAILMKLAELGPQARLDVRIHRDPLPLYERLAERGFAAAVERRGEGDYLVRIRPAHPPAARER